MAYYNPGTYNPGTTNNNGQEQRETKDRKKWAEMMQLASKMNEKQALGFMVGRGLHELWMQHLAKRHDPNEQERRKQVKAEKNFNKLVDKQIQLKQQMDARGEAYSSPWTGQLKYTVTNSKNPEDIGKEVMFDSTLTGEGPARMYARQPGQPAPEISQQAVEQPARLFGDGFKVSNPYDNYGGRDAFTAAVENVYGNPTERFAEAVELAETPKYDFDWKSLFGGRG